MFNRAPRPEDDGREPSVAEKAMFTGGLLLGPIALSNPSNQTGWEVVGISSLVASGASAVSMYLHDRAAQAPSDSETN